ncbi:hypothetical protein KP509_12G054400 [Ceratopteris richardii]|uniref:E3 ubiquitin-protein ligase listerin n=1 Tax=Ceratopteris richardii TaxID=49495 RepID=A0A8T2TJ54_CERRI|nr:hypothetical protein KP509_12G054400 [Ceratopteris richardii]
MLCTWHWPGGSAVGTLLPFLVSCMDGMEKGCEVSIIDNVVITLHNMTMSKEEVVKFHNKYLLGTIDSMDFNEGPALHALLVLLRTICLEHRKVEYAEKCLEMLAIDQRILEEPSLSERSKVLPFILSILVPVLRKKREGMQQCFPLEAAVCKWLEIANSAGPLNAYSELVPDMEHILQVVVSCFPLHTAGGSAAIIAASSSIVSQREKALLLRLMQKEVSGVGSFVANASKSYAMAHDNCPKINDAKLLHEEILAKLVASSVVYCWKDFTNQEWVLVLSHMRKWLEAALLEAEKVREIFKDAGMQGADKPTDSALTILNRINEEMQRSHSKQTDLSWTAVILFSIVHSLEGYNSVEPSTSLEHLISNWREAKHRALSYIVRIFFASGMAESLALDSAAGEVAANLIANSRKSDLGFWENVSEIILSSSKEERIEIARHLNMWTVGKDPVRSLYAMLFSSEPIGGLQHTAYSLLTSVPFQNSAISAVARGDIVDTSTEELNTEQSPLNAAYLRDELSVVLETCTSTISESSLTSPIRVKYFLAWAIVLSHLRLVSVLSPVGEKLVQYIQDSSLSSNLLESIFEHIPLKSGSASSHRKKTSASVWHAEVQKAGDAAKRACTLGSVSSMVDGLWPIEEGSISCLAAGLYGLLLQVLPACVRVWFTGLRDRSLAGSIESFTSKFCSPHLLAEEFSQVHNTTTTDDTLIIKANQSLGEVVVLYKKEEAGMDMVVKMPKCYPLRAVDIDCTRRLGISETRLRKWMLSMAAFLRNQNGAVAEAIQIWRQNVDREFEGVEECPICYSILHTVNHSLPRLACKTCKHKFHSACLYKWFSTSHKSTCPLCQTPF